MALSSENRLKSKKAIAVVLKKGASWKTPFFRAVFLPSRFHQFQSVVVVSKKYDKRAVERNHIRRRINGYLQQRKSEISQKFPENIYVIFPYESAKDVSVPDLEKAIEKMLLSTQNWDFSRKNVKRNFRKK